MYQSSHKTEEINEDYFHFIIYGPAALIGPSSRTPYGRRERGLGALDPNSQINAIVNLAIVLLELRRIDDDRYSVEPDLIKQW